MLALSLLTPLALLVGSPGAVQPRAAGAHCSIAVFGASGGVGSEAVFQALGRGESVNCLVRDASRLLVPPGSGGSSAGSALTNGDLSVTVGDVTKQVRAAAHLRSRQPEEEEAAPPRSPQAVHSGHRPPRAQSPGLPPPPTLFPPTPADVDKV